MRPPIGNNHPPLRCVSNYGARVVPQG